jgi:anhydro-N-acetylmuramic acid kinase
LNEFLMTRLQALASCPVTTSEDYGIDGDAIEAAAFAWLAACCLNGKTGNADAVTGASGLRILGGIYQA